MSMLDTVLLLVNDDESEVTEQVAQVYLDSAIEAIWNRLYPFADADAEIELPKKYESKAISICVYLINKRGAEGELTHTEGGNGAITRQYEAADIPNSMLKDIVPVGRYTAS